MSSDDSITGPVIPYVTPADPSGTLPGGSTATPTPAFGDYELLGVLGQGGMGTVFKAHQRAAGRLVALKVVRPDRLEGLTPAQRASWLERFRTEARAAARIDHDHAVPVYEVGETEGRPFYSVRCVDGRSLADLLGDGPSLPPAPQRCWSRSPAPSTPPTRRASCTAT
jgi:serine/threonine protein kinase